MKPVNEALRKGPLSDFSVQIIMNSVSCYPDQGTLNAAYYRFTVLPASVDLATSRRRRQATPTTFDVALIEQEIREWAVMEEREVTLDDGSLVKIDRSCGTQVLSLDDPPCVLVLTALGLSRDGEGGAVGALVAAVVMGVVLVVVVVVCVLIVIYVTKRNSRK